MEDRLALQLAQFEKASRALDEAIANDDGDKKSRDSILLSYVFTFEMAWKSLKSALAVRGFATPDYAAAVLKAAFQARLIDDAAAWEQIKDCRNNIGHAYDEDKAIEIAAYVRSHAPVHFSRLLARLRRDD
jgi:nucleotidyltransferase substrate binding protein (TIGR01987 family)